MPKKKTLEETINDFKEAWGDTYDYSKITHYKNNRELLPIVCRIHGEFPMSADNHKQHHGCPYCAENIKYTTKTFIQAVKELYGDAYTFEKTNYGRSNKEPVTITCKKHGDITKTPHEILSGKGCKYCGNERKGKMATTKDFIEKALKIHPKGRFDYQYVKYTGVNSEVEIKCQTCGRIFPQVAHYHLTGNGCPFCKMSKSERDVIKRLEDTNIPYSYEKQFDWLGKQNIDFYLPDYNIGIECQGIQHFQSSIFFGGEEHFKLQQELDQRKARLCKANGVKLLYYTNVKFDEYPYEVYTDIDELMKEITKRDKL